MSEKIKKELTVKEKEIAHRLGALMLRLGLKQNGLGKILSIDEGTVSKYINAEMKIAQKVYVELFTSLKVNKRWLIEGKGKMFYWVGGETDDPPTTTASTAEDTSPTMGEIYNSIDIYVKEELDDLLEHYPTEEIPQIPQDYRHVDIVNAINLLIAIENKRREKNKHDKDS